jgi:hypothetical protein
VGREREDINLPLLQQVRSLQNPEESYEMTSFDFI